MDLTHTRHLKCLNLKVTIYQTIGQKPYTNYSEYDERCDLFSFGCLIYFMLSGESPLLTDAITNQIR